MTTPERALLIALELGDLAYPATQFLVQRIRDLGSYVELERTNPEPAFIKIIEQGLEAALDEQRKAILALEYADWHHNCYGEDGEDCGCQVRAIFAVIRAQAPTEPSR